MPLLVRGCLAWADVRVLSTVWSVIPHHTHSTVQSGRCSDGLQLGPMGTHGGSSCPCLRGHRKGLREGRVGISHVKEKGKGIPGGGATSNNSLVERKHHFWGYVQVCVWQESRMTSPGVFSGGTNLSVARG